MICIAFTLIGIIGFGTCAEVGVVPIDAARAALKSGSLFDVDELVEIIRERLNITTLNAEIAANKHGVAANRNGVAANKNGVNANKHGVAANKKEISVKSKDITTIKTDIINLRSDLTHCVTGWANAWYIKDGSWYSKKISFSKSFSRKPQFMVAVMGAGKSRGGQNVNCPVGQAIEFEVSKVKVSESSFTIRVMTLAGEKEKSCYARSYVYFSYIACGTY